MRLFKKYLPILMMAIAVAITVSVGFYLIDDFKVVCGVFFLLWANNISLRK